MSSRSDSTEPDPTRAGEPPGDRTKDQNSGPWRPWENSPILRETFLSTTLGMTPGAALLEASRVIYLAILSGDDTLPPAVVLEPGDHVRQALQGAALDLEYLQGFLREHGTSEVDQPATDREQHWRETADTVAHVCGEGAAALRADESIFPVEEGEASP